MNLKYDLEYKGKIRKIEHVIVSDPSYKKDVFCRFEKENLNERNWIANINIFPVGEDEIDGTEFFLLLRKNDKDCNINEEGSITYLNDIEIKDYKIGMDTACIAFGINASAKEINNSNKEWQPPCSIRTGSDGYFGQVTEGIRDGKLCFLLITGYFDKDFCDENRLLEYIIKQFDITELEKQNTILVGNDRQLNKGDIVEVSFCSINNDVGGTTMIRNKNYKSEIDGMKLTIHESDGTVKKEVLKSHDELVDNLIEVEVVKGWYDYETGYRYVGKVCNSNLIEELKKAGTTGFTPNDYKKYSKEIYEDAIKGKENFDPSKIYFSEFDVIKILKKNNESEVEF